MKALWLVWRQCCVMAILSGLVFSLFAIGIQAASGVFWKINGWSSFVIEFCYPLVVIALYLSEISAAFGWLFMTPISRLRIWVAMIFLNLSLVAIAYVMCNFAYAGLALLVPSSSLPFMSLVSWFAKDSSAYPATAGSYMLWASVMLLTLSFFGVYSVRWEIALGDRSNSNKFFSKWRTIHLLLLGGFCGVVITALGAVFPKVFAPVLYVSFWLAVVLGLLVLWTLMSLRVYYKLWRINLLVCLLGISLATLFYAKSRDDIYNAKLEFHDRINAVSYLGYYAPKEALSVLDDVIKSGDVTSQALGYSKFEDYLELHEKPDVFASELRKHFSSLCSTRNGVGCRFEAYSAGAFTDNRLDYSLIKKGCPLDLRSCEIILDHRDSIPKDNEWARQIIEERCSIDASHERRFCQRYWDSKKSKTEREIRDKLEKAARS